MPPINLLKLWKKRGEGFYDYTGCTDLPVHLIQKANDLFESQLTAPGWEAWIENSEANKPSQVRKLLQAVRWEQSCRASQHGIQKGVRGALLCL